jgi:diaminopimelate decarboxylase
VSKTEQPSVLSVFPPGAGVGDEGRLTIAGCDAVGLAREYGTPLYVYDEAGVRARCAGFLREFRALAAETAVLYAAKAFTNTAMIRLVAEEGLGLDVVSGGEIEYARAAGFPMEKVSFAGNNKSAAELELALEAGVGTIVVDNLLELIMLREMARGRSADILLRLAPGVDPGTHRYNTTGTADSKFGVPRPVWDEAVRTALATGELNLLGLHFHLGSGLYDVAPYREAIGVVMDYAAEARALGLDVIMLSIGGGFAARYDIDREPPPVSAYAEAIVGALKEACARHGLPRPSLVVEPGRSIVAQNGVALYTVGVIKDVPGVRTYVNVDGGMGDNIRYPLYGYVQGAVIADRPAAEGTRSVRITGKFCESGDVLIPEISLPDSRPGDVLAVAGSGAYAVPMASNYNGSYRPAIVFVKDGQARLVRRRETIEDLTGRDVA